MCLCGLSESIGCQVVSRFKNFPAIRASLDRQDSWELGDSGGG
jgi:hypothetical protein